MVQVETPQNIEFGKYRLIRRIATGGMAELWLAIQRGPHGFEKTAVLKVILPNLCANEEFVHMFLNEARLAAGLDHNNVVRLYDFGEIDGQYYLAMEHLPGEDLASIIHAHKRAGRPVPLEVACDIIIGAATGLNFAHELTDAHGRPLNIVHRDVSPSNIILTYHGTVKLVDFGIARAETNISTTTAGTLKGKVAYVSPEQASGEPVDRRSDIFPLGTVLFELLTLQRPFKRESDLATLQAVVNAPIPPPRSLRPEIPADLEAIVLKAMTRKLSERYQHALEVADALSSFLDRRGYIRSERALAQYMSGLFDAERRQDKLRVVQPTNNGRTPSQLKHLAQHLSPLRSDTVVPAAKIASPSKQPRRRLTAVALGGAGLVALVAALAFWGLTAHPSGPTEGPPAVAKAPSAMGNQEQRQDPPKPMEQAAELPRANETEAKPEESKPTMEPRSTEPGPEARKPADARSRNDKGTLTLDTSPWSEVFLKGKKLGDTPLIDQPLAAGIHVLTLVNEQRNLKVSIEIEIRPGKSTIKKLKL